MAKWNVPTKKEERNRIRNSNLEEVATIFEAAVYFNAVEEDKERWYIDIAEAVRSWKEPE
jgi:hypothetical protein